MVLRCPFQAVQPGCAGLALDLGHRDLIPGTGQQVVQSGGLTRAARDRSHRKDWRDRLRARRPDSRFPSVPDSRVFRSWGSPFRQQKSGGQCPPLVLLGLQTTFAGISQYSQPSLANKKRPSWSYPPMELALSDSVPPTSGGSLSKILLTPSVSSKLLKTRTDPDRS